MTSWLSPGTDFAVLDESGNGNQDQLLIVGLALLESLERTEEAVRDLYSEFADSYHLEGHQGLIQFVANGPHASEDPLEIQIAMNELVSQLPGCRILMSFSDRSAMPELSEEDRLIVLYRDLLSTAVRYFRREKAELHFESNSRSLDSLFPRIVERVAWRYAREAPDRHRVEVTTVIDRKGELLALSVIDYAMITFSRWYSAGQPMDPQNALYRNYRAIERNIAFVGDLDHRKSSNRANRTFH